MLGILRFDMANDFRRARARTVLMRFAGMHGGNLSLDYMARSEESDDAESFHGHSRGSFSY